jgi:hypothetical protein
MRTRVSVKKRPAIDAVYVILISISIILISGCLQDSSATGTQNNQTLQTPVRTETVTKIPIEKVSGELNMLNSKDWGKLASQLKRPRTTTLLWYHLKKTVGFEPKVVFGAPDKLNTAIAIPVKQGGNSTIPKIRIKGVEYYIVDPTMPSIISEFDYGYMYDDPGSVPSAFFNDFRLNTEDIGIVERWMKETGASLSYTDFPVK